MEHIDKNRISFHGSGWNYRRDMELPINQAISAGYTAFFRRDGETCVEVDGKMIPVNKLFGRKEEK